MIRVAGNYPGHKKYEPTGWRCQACPNMLWEDQDHLTSTLIVTRSRSSSLARS